MDLNSALSQLQLVDEDQKDIRLAVGTFVGCHTSYLATGDVNGVYWSLQFLQGIARRASYTPDELFICIRDCLEADEVVESRTALASFHVAKMITGSSAETVDVEETGKWYRECFGNARTGYLKHLAAVGLGQTLLSSGMAEGALEWFEAAREAAREQWEDSFAIASYLAAKALVTLGNFREAIRIFHEASVLEQGYFVSALASLLYADMQSCDKETSAENIVKAHAAARRKLVRMMQNLHINLVEYCCDCSSDLLFKYANLDNFSQYFIDLASSSTGEPAKQIQRSFFIFEVYRNSRKAMVKARQALQAFMDPRPHLEQGIEMLISKDHAAAVDQLVLCQQVAVKAGHTSCLHLLRGAFQSLVRRYSDVTEIRSLLVTAFKQWSVDGEDAEAWALFYVGHGGLDEEARLSEVHFEVMKEALSRSTTSMLGFYVTNILGPYGSQAPGNTIDAKLKYLELSRVCALETGKPDLIISAFHHLFELVMLESWMFDRASSVQRELKEISSSFTEPDRTLGLAVATYMLGVVMQHYSRFVLGHDALGIALKMLDTLPRFRPLGCLHFYLSNDGEDAWSFERNQTALTTSRNIMLLLREHRPDLTSLLEDDEEKLRDRNQLSTMMDRLQEANLDEAEQQAAELLQWFEDHDNKTCGAIVRMELAQLASRKHRQALSDGKTGDLGSTLDIIHGFMKEAAVLARSAAELAPVKFLGVWLPAFYSKILLKLGQKAAALEKLVEFLGLACFELDDNFGRLSTGRIINLEVLRPYFRDLESLLWDFNRLHEAVVWGERQRARDLLYTLRSEEDLESRLKELVEFDREFERAWSDVHSVCDLVGRETVLLVISHRRFEDVIYTYLLNSEVELVGHRHDHITPVAELLQTRGSSRKILAEYYDVLIRPFARELEQVQPKRIIFVPSEDMCMVPFGALMDESMPERQYLIQRYVTSTVSSLRLLKQCELRARELNRQRRVRKEVALVVGNPTRDLEYAEAEAAFVEDMLGQAGFSDIRKPRTKQVVLSVLPQCSWMHIACHGIVSDEFPDGALLLSSETGTSCSVRALLEASLKGDTLTGDEVQQLKVAFKASGVILSACSSGLGRVFSEGILALPRSFHVMGVPSVLVSLWKVDDEATKLLMERMYGRLLRGMQLGEALQGAMVEMLEEEDEMGCETFQVGSWAPFVVSGTPLVSLV